MRTRLSLRLTYWDSSDCGRNDLESLGPSPSRIKERGIATASNCENARRKAPIYELVEKVTEVNGRVGLEQKVLPLVGSSSCEQRSVDL